MYEWDRGLIDLIFCLVFLWLRKMAVIYSALSRSRGRVRKWQVNRWRNVDRKASERTAEREGRREREKGREREREREYGNRISSIENEWVEEGKRGWREEREKRYRAKWIFNLHVVFIVAYFDCLALWPFLNPLIKSIRMENQNIFETSKIPFPGNYTQITYI